jgi:hypothetical protein
MTFLLSEDKALRDLLKGMVVTDQKSDATGSATRNVGVFFGQPDQELRQQSYPYITIDMIDISEDIMRAMRGLVKPNYLPNPDRTSDGTVYDPENQNWYIHWPIPVNIDYQITTYCRQPRHDRELLAQIMYNKIPLRFAVLEVDNNDAQGTIRRLDVLDISKRDVTEQGKRLFVNSFTVRVSSEISPEVYKTVYKALEVDVTGVTGSTPQGGTHPPFTAIDSFITRA